MEFNVNAYNETFLTSNIAPQDHNLTLEFGIDGAKNTGG
jgi:DNA/RNA endonuclease G (NUC1)